MDRDRAPASIGGWLDSAVGAATLAALLALALAAPALTGGFVLDDLVAVEGSACVRGTVDLGTLWSRTFWCEDPGGPLDTAAWRPLTVSIWRGLWRLGAGAPWIFHALSALLHAATAAFVVAVARGLGATPRAALFAALAFAVMPLHAEVAASIVGAAAGLAALLTITAAWLASRDTVALPARIAGATVSAFAACLAREDGVLVFPLVVACALMAPTNAGNDAPPVAVAVAVATWRRRALVCVGVLVAVAAALLWRAAVLPELSAAAVPEHVNPMVGLDPVARIKSAFGLAWRYHAVAFAGGPLAADYAYDAIPVGPHMAWWRAALGAILVGTGIGIGWGLRTRAPAVSVGLAWWLMGLALATHLIVTTPALFAERVVYGASAGLCLALGAGLDALMDAAPHRRRLLAGLAAVWLGVMAWRFGVHASRWRDAETLVEHTVAVVPNNARARAWAAELALRGGDPDSALTHARAAQHLRPRWGRPVAFEAAALDQLGEPQTALDGFRRAMALDAADPQTADLFIQFLNRYGHRAQAQMVEAMHAAAVDGRAPPDLTPAPPAR